MNDSTDITELERQARECSRRGDTAGIERACLAILERQPDHLSSLGFLADHAARRGAFGEAEGYLRRAIEVSPADENFHAQLAQVLYRQGKREAAVAAYGDYFQLNSQNPMLYLALGCLHAEMGNEDKAAQVFSLGESVDPQLLSHWQRDDANPALKAMSRTAWETLRRHHTALHMGAVDRFDPGPDVQRIRDAVWPLVDEREVDYANEKQRPQVFYIRYGEAPPFFERDSLSWVAEIESRYPEIRREILAGLDVAADGRPYLGDGHRLEGEQWEPVVNKMNWASVHLYSQGIGNPGVAEKFPVTLAALAHAPLSTRNGNPAEVFISVLAPHIRIPEHYGVSSAILTVHLPILVPEGCGLMAGGETRTPEEGRILAFDDTWEHCAWNNSDDTRVVLIFETWHPQLTEKERSAVLKTFEARRQWLDGRSVV